MRNKDTAETGQHLQHNPWGYQVNVNHPQVRPFYERYKTQKGIPKSCPLSDSERRQFEAAFLAGIERKVQREAEQKVKEG